ncbi:MAG: tRNA pseudouridine(38-40) synthase TruA [Thermoleophilia bacterium]|nr:tRNA pseudouridine(38-40) synthase TruA [Thermoleophilia bacterium]
MPTLRLTVEYDGAGFSGWAAQPGLRTCEGELREALQTALRSPVELRVAGRTDAGVSATGQVVSVHTDSTPDPRRLVRALPALLPDDLNVRAVAAAPDGFDARRDATSRTYEYRVLNAPRSPMRRGRVLDHPAPLDVAAMRRAAAACEGQHDFTAFTPTDTQHVFFDRTVLASRWERRGDELVYTVEANAFLRHMVRVLVGTMLEVGRGRRTPEGFATLLGGAPRTAAGTTAPAHPLTLVGVAYPPALGTGPRAE